MGYAPVNAAYLIHYDKGLLDADAQVDLGGRGNFTLSTTGFVEPMPGGIGPSLREGVYETTLSTGAMDLTLLELFLEEDMPKIAGLRGRQDSVLRPDRCAVVQGHHRSPGAHRRRLGPGRARLHFPLRVRRTPRQVRLADDEGELIETEGASSSTSSTSYGSRARRSKPSPPRRGDCPCACLRGA